MSAAGADNVNDNANGKDVIFTIKDTQLYVPVVALSARDNLKLRKFLAKDLPGQFIGMNIKQKEIIKLQQRNLDIFSNQTLLELIDCLF